MHIIIDVASDICLYIYMQYSTSTYNDIEYFSQSNCTLQPTKFKLCKLIRYESYVNILHCQHSKQFKNAIIFFTSPTHSMSVTGGSLLTINSVPWIQLSKFKGDRTLIAWLLLITFLLTTWQLLQNILLYVYSIDIHCIQKFTSTLVCAPPPQWKLFNFFCVGWHILIDCFQ